MRPLFYDFPQDSETWSLKDEYMFGPDVLAAPLLEMGERQRKVYLPAGSWYDFYTGQAVQGGDWVTAEAPLDTMPVYVRNRDLVLS